MSSRIALIEQCCNPLKLLHNLHTGRGGVLRQRSLNAECKHLHTTVLTDVFLSPCSNILHPSYNHVFWKCWTSCYLWVWKGNPWKAQSITSKHETFICNQLTRCLIGASTFVKKGLANDQSALFKRPHFFLSPELKLLMTDRNIWTECNTTHTHTSCGCSFSKAEHAVLSKLQSLKSLWGRVPFMPHSLSQPQTEKSSGSSFDSGDLEHSIVLTLLNL